jgi:NAD(P)-dependent dehydrogenase (short-subunit alcohol dehydrogenase family)
MSSLDDIRSFVHSVDVHFGQIDILVNNAGSSLFASFFDIPDERWMSDIQTKFLGYVRMCRETIPVMRRGGGGRIVNVAGNAGKQPLTYHMPGAAANAGILNFTKSLSEQVAKDGIIVNAVSPGPIETARMRKTFERLSFEWSVPLDEARLRYSKDLLLGYIPSPEEIANTIVYLASPRAAYIAGTSITIDGGITKGI